MTEEASRQLADLLTPRLTELADLYPGMDDTFLKQLERSLAGSDFIYREMLSQPEHFRQHLPMLAAKSEPWQMNYREKLEDWLQDCRDDADYMSRLRQFRRLHCALIAWRDINELDSLTTVLGQLSELADCCIESALVRAESSMMQSHGELLNSQGKKQRLVVLGMGKLGARELNFSSDVDLIFCFHEHGQSNGPRELDSERYYIRLGQKLIHYLDEISDQGQVYRVDMRLRPHGKAGRLATSFSALEHYYQREGRTWERYALIKARPVAGDQVDGEEILKRLNPFIYRKYLDFTAFEDIRLMKRNIDREIHHEGLEYNIKLGRGGIREAEFFVQVYQLLRGGRIEQLQQPPLLQALQVMVRFHLLAAAEASALVDAYSFLRVVENRLQILNDQQVHDLPENPFTRHRLIISLAIGDWASFEQKLAAHRMLVHRLYRDLVEEPTENNEPAEDNIWLMIQQEKECQALLKQAGFDNTDSMHQQLDAFSKSIEIRQLHAKARERLDRLMPITIHLCGKRENPDLCLERMLQILLKIASRSAYLAFLTDNPAVLDRLTDLAGRSAWIADHIAAHPILLDDLLDVKNLEQIADSDHLADNLEKRLAALPGEDQEQEYFVLRDTQQSAILRIASAELDGQMQALEASSLLTRLAEVMLDQCLTLAVRDRTGQYGQPSAIEGKSVQYGLLLYGTFGGETPGFSSDLDLVFLHDGAYATGETDGNRQIANDTWFARLMQRLMHILTTRTATGILYEVDLRLRPNGNSGLLVSSLAAFEKYQLESAWTWEKQALVKARMISRSPELVSAFDDVRRKVLCQTRDRETLAREICEMREKMREGKLISDEQFDLKHSPGGLVDLEFICQFAVLCWSEEFPALCQPRKTTGILREIANCGLLPQQQVDALATAFVAYLQGIHQAGLQNKPCIYPSAEYSQYASDVLLTWKNWLCRD